MSHYVMNYHDCWADLRKAVKAARADYFMKVERATPYLPSEKAQEDIEAAKADFEAALEAARADAAPRFARIIADMKEHVGKPDMKAPTQDMIATLTMLDMRDRIDSEEVEAACKLMGTNSAALTTLAQVVMRHGGVMPIGFKTPDAQAQEAVARLQDAASRLMVWDGRTGQEISSDALRKRHDNRWADGEPMNGHERDAQWVADIEARSFYKDTARAIVGDVPMSVIDALE